MFTAMRYPLAGDRPVRTLALGALLSVLGVFLLPGVFVAGFYGRVLARNATDERPPPSFADWGAMAAHGLKTWLVSLLYLSVGFILAVVVGFAAIAAGWTVGNGVGGWLGLVALGLLAVVVVGAVSLPVWFFMPVALARLALSGRVATALELRTILRTAIKPAYLVRWVAGVAVVTVGWLVYGVVSLGVAVPGVGELAIGQPLVGHVVGASVNFYCQVVAFALFGRGYAAAVRGSDHDPLLAEVEAEMTVPDDDGWGHSGRLPAWGELRQAGIEERVAGD